MKAYDFSAKQRAEIQRYANREFNRRIDHYNRDASMMIFYVLHTELGFGVKRLKRFHRAFDAMQEQLIKRYEMNEIDTPWICEEKLRQAGFDIDDLMQEEQDEN